MKVCCFSMRKAVLTQFFLTQFYRQFYNLIIAQPKSCTISVCKLRIKISLLVDGLCKIHTHIVLVICLCVKWLVSVFLYVNLWSAIFLPHVAAVRATLKLECRLYGDVFLLKVCLNMDIQKSQLIQIYIFFSNLRVFQEKKNLSLKMRYIRLSNITASYQALIKIS